MKRDDRDREHVWAVCLVAAIVLPALAWAAYQAIVSLGYW